MKLEDLRKSLLKSWSAETSSSASWTSKNSAEGQCAVTALIVQDYLGGDILKTYALTSTGRISHYYNSINGVEIDLTKDQFNANTQFEGEITAVAGHASLREYCLSFKDTRIRYQLLRSRITNDNAT
jgi:hypothetical protein